MQKTKLGITVGALGAITFFAGFFSSYLAVIVLAGYVLLFEENEWLKMSAVKAIVLMTFFSVLIAVINLLPDVVDFFGDIASAFRVNVLSHFSGYSVTLFVSRIIWLAVSGLSIVEKVLLFVLGIKAFNQKTIAIQFIDEKICKYIY